MRDGRFVGYGHVAAAELVNEGRHLVAFRFQPSGAPPGYYDAAGRSLKRFFLRSPLKFDPQVSSGFSPAASIRFSTSAAHISVSTTARQSARPWLRSRSAR